MTADAQARAPGTDHVGRLVMHRDQHGYTSGYQAHCTCGWLSTIQPRQGLAIRDLYVHTTPSKE